MSTSGYAKYEGPDEMPGTSADHAQQGDEHDSGYGGSVKLSDLEADAVAHDGHLLEAGKGHRRSPSLASQQQAVSQISQLQYNDNRLALGRSIAAVLKILKELQVTNKQWPIYYPTTPGTSENNVTENEGDGDLDALERELDGEEQVGDDEGGGNVPPAPRLVSPEISKDFNIFKLDLKLGSLSSDALVHSLEKSSVASLIEEKILRAIKHLNSLRERIDDTASKVLITGDLNSGKSTFCNALLRRRLLPTDQQPCTNVFCEIRDSLENDGMEEVHAVKVGKRYERTDQNTYEIRQLKELEDLVYEVEKYSILKVFVEDKRNIEHSLLRNGVVDISLIDAPGLNKDSYQTTQVFSRQEEIDLVVFVVSAENHFTLSAKEFISNAAHEKSLVFIVVNRFDHIKDKSRCMRRILDQVADLSPETHKDARDFVHFVSSGNVVDGLPGDDDDGNGGGDDGPGDDDDPPPDPEGDNPDFDQLEASLRHFVLEKRAISKLKPAKTYLDNILHDLEVLADVNQKMSKQERDRLLDELNALTPKFEKAVSTSVKVSEKIDQDIEKLSDGVYNHTVTYLNDRLSEEPETSLSYSNVLDSYNFAVETRQKIINKIQEAVHECEQQARKETVKSIDAIKNLGIMHVGDKPVFHKVFKEEAMFSKRRDDLARSIVCELTFMDFIDLSLPQQFIPQLIPQSIYPEEKMEVATLSTVNNALTLASVVGGSQLIRHTEWIKHGFRAIGFVNYSMVKKLVVPVIIVASACGVAYIVSEIPNAVPKNLTKKINREVQALGYVHSNADRISKECRKVLRYPAQDVRAGFQTDIEHQARQKEDFSKRAKDADEGFKYFSKLYKEAAHQRHVVSQCVLELH
jgi:mitofusin